MFVIMGDISPDAPTQVEDFEPMSSEVIDAEAPTQIMEAANDDDDVPTQVVDPEAPTQYMGP